MFKVPFFGAKATEDPSTRYEQICSAKFILDYLEQRNIPQIDPSTLSPYVGYSKSRGFVNKGSSASVLLCFLKKSINPIVKIRVVVKQVESRHMFPEVPVIQFLNEIRGLASPSLCPNIINFYGFCCDYNTDYNTDKNDPNKLWIVMEHAQKGFLSPRIIRRLSYHERILRSLTILEGLYALHARGIVHGDLKLANIFVDKDGSFRLGDLGCSFSGNEKISLLDLNEYEKLKRKQSLIDEHMPAIVKIAEQNFKFVVKTEGLLSNKDSNKSEKNQSALTEIDCPENLLPMVSQLFSQHDDPSNQPTKIASLLIPWEDPVMHFLEKEGYCGPIPEEILAKNRCVGSPVCMAPELYQVLYAPESKSADYFRRRPNFLSDLYSLAIVMYGIWTGKIPHRKRSKKSSATPLIKEIVGGLRPTITKMYSEQGLVEVSTLPEGSRILQLKQLIIAAWDADPCNRTPLETFVDFFREWLHEILLELFIKNKVCELNDLLKKIEDPDILLRKKDRFRDNPYRKPHPMSLVQYALWACSPCSPVVLKYIPESQFQSQKTELLKSSWVKDNDENAIVIIDRLPSLYDAFEKSKKIEGKRLTWHNIGRSQRKLPVPLVWSYCEKKGIVLDIELWYENIAPRFNAIEASFSATYSACYSRKDTLVNEENSTKEEKFSLLKGEISNKKEEFSFPGFDLYREKEDFETLREEVKASQTLCI